jgi:hypothetical protein
MLFSDLSGVDHLAVRLEYPDASSVIKCLDPNAISFLSLGVEQCDVGNVDRHVFLDNATRETLHRIRALVLFDAIDTLDQQVINVNATQHGAALPLILAGNNDYVVTFSDFLHG